MMGDINAETAFVENAETVKVTAPTPASINMPDHELRRWRSYQLFVRLARPTLDWVTVGGVAWNLIINPWAYRAFDVVAATLALTWAAAVYGIKTFEKTKGVA